MAEAVTNQTIQRLGQRLAVHPIYTAVASIEDLRCFMQHHVYSVWDFMSLIKYLQAVVAPTQYPWLPGQDPSVQRFINELVLEEETDSHPLGDGHASHFELYLQGMQEVGADTGPVRRFVDQVQRNGIDTALDRADIPIPARDFTRTTFDFITTGRPHLAAAALALGREHVIPGMFRSILRESGVDVGRRRSFTPISSVMSIWTRTSMHPSRCACSMASVAGTVRYGARPRPPPSMP